MAYGYSFHGPPQAPRVGNLCKSLFAVIYQTLAGCKLFTERRATSRPYPNLDRICGIFLHLQVFWTLSSPHFQVFPTLTPYIAIHRRPPRPSESNLQ